MNHGLSKKEGLECEDSGNVKQATRLYVTDVAFDVVMIALISSG